MLHLYNLVHPTMVLNWSFVTFCHFFDPVCKYALYMVSDREVSLDNMARDDVYYSLFPSGCGWRNFMHYAQLIRDGGFRRYDWGVSKNREVYGVGIAPDYDLRAFKDLPVALLYGDTDELADAQDVQWLIGQLPERSLKFAREYHLGHMSFHIAKDMSHMQDVVALLKTFTGMHMEDDEH